MNNLSSNQETLLNTVYIPNCNAALTAIQTASANLDTDKAAVWTHNKNEVRDRFNLYKLQCQLMIQFLGLESPGNTINGISMVV